MSGSSRDPPRSTPAQEGGVRSHGEVILREVAAKRVGQSSAVSLARRGVGGWRA